MSNVTTTEPLWPPKSPHDVLLSTPSGRNRLRQLGNRLSPSPSPLKRTTSTPSFRKRAQELLQMDGANDQEDEEEDEETLQLQLKAIETKLKLKKLRNAKAKGVLSSSDIENDGRVDSRLASKTGALAGSRANSSLNGRQQTSEAAKRLRRAQSQPEVQVPLSPPRQVRKLEDPISPSRVLLGIDKGLRAQDVSLRRAPNLRRGNDDARQRYNSNEGHLRKPSAAESSSRVASSLAVRVEERPKTFSEKMAESRTNERNKKEREEKILRSRSKGFGIDEKDLEQYRNAADAAQEDAEPQPDASGRREFGRDEVLQAASKTRISTLRKAGTVLNIHAEAKAPGRDTTSLLSNGSLAQSHQSSHTRSLSSTYSSRPPSAPPPDTANSTSSSTNPQPNTPHFESFSTLHLSKRRILHTDLARHLAGKHTFLLPDLLRTVKSPSYDPPDVEGDWVAFGAIASKSTPLDHKDNGRKGTGGEPAQKSKFMAITLTDLKWECTLYLFGTGFERFWKLTPGTVIALLNPGIMPPKPHEIDTGKFSLTISSSDDTILEIGTARDLGWCKSIKKDGKECAQWVDKRHTEFCAYHVNAQVSKVKAGRMEVNTITAPFGPGGSGKPRFFGGGGRGRGGGGNPYGSKSNFQGDGLRKEGAQHDRVNGTYFVTPSIPTHIHANTGGGRSAAALLDDDYYDPDAFHRGSREERLTRRLAEREKEREIAKRLADMGGGMGSEYLRARAADQSKQPSDDASGGQEAAPAIEVLTGGRAEHIRLSPIKRKRGASQLSGSGSSSSGMPAGMGWSFKSTVGSALRSATVKETTTTVKTTMTAKDEDQLSPAKKKTRFRLPKGMREPGRESLGDAVVVGNGDVEMGEGDESDDGLDIV